MSISSSFNNTLQLDPFILVSMFVVEQSSECTDKVCGETLGYILIKLVGKQPWVIKKAPILVQAAVNLTMQRIGLYWAYSKTHMRPESVWAGMI